MAGHPSGSAWCAQPNAEHAVLVRIGDNDTIARTALRVPMLPVSRAERDETIAAFRERLRPFATNTFHPSKIRSQRPGMAALHVDADGRLWLEHARAYKSNETTFDVHDVKGAHLGRVRIPYRTDVGMPVRARGMAAWFAVIDEDDVVSVVRFALSR